MPEHIDITWINTLSIPVIVLISIGLGEILKRIGLAAKWLPIVNIILAIVGSFIWSMNVGWRVDLAMGFIIGLMTSGIYSSFKNVFSDVLKQIKEFIDEQKKNN